MKQSTIALQETLNCPTVLLMTTKHMGNLLLCLRSMATLVKANPDKTLIVLDEAYRDIVESIPELSGVLYYPRKRLSDARTFEKLKLLRAFYASLWASGAKRLINFDSQLLSTTIAIGSRVKTRWGLPDSARPGLYTKIIDNDSAQPHRVFHFAQHVQHLMDASDATDYPELQALSKHRDSLQFILQTYGLNVHRPYMCIHGGATKGYKQWPTAQFASSADWLAEQGYQVVFIGAGESDRKITEQILKQSTGAHINLCNALKLGELIALFSQCTLFLGNDSGPMHLAAASGAQVFALFGPTDELRWGPLGDQATIIRNPIPCDDSCSKKSCLLDYRCIKLLSQDFVQDIISRQLVAPAKTINANADQLNATSR